MAPQRIIVKRHGHMEEFDARKIYASVYAAGLNAHLGEREAEKLADNTATKAKKYFSKKEGLDSKEIKNFIIQELGGEENDVAYLYLHHLDIN